MSDMKELLLNAVESLERLYLEARVLEALLEGAHVPDWRRRAEDFSNDPVMQSLARRQFQPLYDVVRREAQADKALAELLRVLPKPQQWN